MNNQEIKEQNSKSYNKKIKILIGAILFLVFIYILLLVSSINHESKIYENADQYAKDYNSLDTTYDQAQSLYKEASVHYSVNEFNKTINKCKEARELYKEYSQELYNHRARLEYTELPERFEQLYYELISEEIEISNNMFEVCEYFESAAFYYSNNDIGRGDSSIESMNEKIDEHDDAVRRYNEILGKIIAYQESL